MTTRSSKLLGSETLAEGTMAFHLERPADFEFRPGQSIDLYLETGSGAAGQDVMHTFSMVSAPHEETLTVATRMRDSAYKRRLGSLRPGGELYIDGPFGTALVLDEESPRPAVLIAGGIGITPFMSILRHAGRQDSTRQLILLYSNRRPQDTAYLDELQQLERKLPGFRLVATMTGMADSAEAWEGPVGYLDAERIADACRELDNPLFYLSGPPMLVEAMRDILEDIGVDDEDIHSEGFTGY